MLAFAFAAAALGREGVAPPALYKRRLAVQTAAMGGVDLDGLVVPVALSVDDGFDPDHAPSGLLRFEDVDGTELPYEVERWDPAGTSSVWVRLAGTPTLWVFYGGPGDPRFGPDADATWSGALGVWHLSDVAPDGDCADAVGGPVLCGAGGDTLFATGASVDVGLVASGRALLSDAHLTRIPEDDDPLDTVTFEMWARLDDGEPTWRDTFVAGPNWALHRCRFGRIGVYEDGRHECFDSSVDPTEEWHQLVMTVGPASFVGGPHPGVIELWLDGALLFAQQPPPFAWVPDLSEVWFGAAPYFPGYGLDGTLDEIRAYPTALPPERIYADFVAMREGGPPVVAVGEEILVAPPTSSTSTPTTEDTGSEPPPPADDPERQLVGGRCGCSADGTGVAPASLAGLALALVRRARLRVPARVTRRSGRR